MEYHEAIQPERDLMLVRREPGDETEWRGIVIPESARKTQEIQGSVVANSLFSPYPVGTRIIMHRGAGTVLALEEGDNEELAIIAPIDVLALLPDTVAKGSSVPVDVDLQAPAGHLLVERAEMPTMRGRIYLSPGVVASTRSCQARITAVGAGLEDEYRAGEGVLLSINAGRAVHQGMRNERTLWKVSPSLVLARLDPEFVGIENRGAELQPIPEWEVAAHEAIDEGSPEALR